MNVTLNNKAAFPNMVGMFLQDACNFKLLNSHQKRVLFDKYLFIKDILITLSTK